MGRYKVLKKGKVQSYDNITRMGKEVGSITLMEDTKYNLTKVIFNIGDKTYNAIMNKYIPQKQLNEAIELIEKRSVNK